MAATMCELRRHSAHHVCSPDSPPRNAAFRATPVPLPLPSSQRGVDFPARLLPPDDAGAPYYTPPVLPYGAPPVVAPGTAPGAAQGPYPAAPPGAGPLIGPDVSAEDAAAIRAAVAEMEAEAGAHAAPGPAAAAAAAAAAQGFPAPAGAPAPPGAAAPAPGLPAVPRSAEEVEQAVRVASNSAELLAEMLAPMAAAGGPGAAAEPFVVDLADQCYRWPPWGGVVGGGGGTRQQGAPWRAGPTPRSWPPGAAFHSPGGPGTLSCEHSGVLAPHTLSCRPLPHPFPPTPSPPPPRRHRSVLSEVIATCEAEELLSAALAANDELSKALTAYEGVAGRPAPGAAPAAAGGEFAAPAQQQLGAAGGPRLPTSSSAGGAAPGGALLSAGGTANFSLLDEGDDEEAAELATSRLAAAARPAAPAAPVAPSVPASAGPDLIDLGPSVGGPTTASSVGAAAPQAPSAGAAASEAEAGVARLGLGGPASAPAAQP
jgi:nicotinate-nucleotide--dimethylbenzimidazole phosphoribosyltransferase